MSLRGGVRCIGGVCVFCVFPLLGGLLCICTLCILALLGLAIEPVGHLLTGAIQVVKYGGTQMVMLIT